mgnify:CR=1 FL=1
MDVPPITFPSGSFLERVILSVFIAFDWIVTDLLITPILLVSYLTLISPEAPGATSSLGHWGTVQPQDPLALVIFKGLVPLFVNTKIHSPLAPCSICP